MVFLILLASFTGAVATYANNNEDSPLLWGLMTAVLCIVGGVFGVLGMVIAGAVSFGLYYAKLQFLG